MVGLLAGNTCIVRLPAQSPELDHLLQCLKNVQAQGIYDATFDRFILLRYVHDDEITTQLSGLADVRVIWGGDSTINHIRCLPTKPRCVDVAFADRVSLALLKCEAILECSELSLRDICSRFVADSLTFGQNACSSPRLVIWHGQDDAEMISASTRFWKIVEEILASRSLLEPINVMDRFCELCEVLATSDDLAEISAPGSAILRVQMNQPMHWHTSSRLRFGTFVEVALSSLADVVDFLNEKVQTLTYFGYQPEEIREWMTERVLGRVDQVVPMGSALDFDLTWDGFPMIEMMTRRVRLR